MPKHPIASLSGAALAVVLAASLLVPAATARSTASQSTGSAWIAWQAGEPAGTPAAPSGPGTPGKPGKSGEQTTGSIVQTDQMWVCNGPVNLDSVTVTMTPASIGSRRDEDAIHLQPGCTGRIGRIDVTQYAADGLKSTEGVHDLTIGGGTIRCLGKAPNLHQDGAQIMGGDRITLENLTIDCGRANDTLINSNLFIKQAGKSADPPTDVVCDHCDLGGFTAHTVNIQASIRSGVTNSTLCSGKYPRLTLTIGSDAQSPVNAGNSVGSC
jgi:hypothetical protein